MIRITKVRITYDIGSVGSVIIYYTLFLMICQGILNKLRKETDNAIWKITEIFLIHN